jgi:CO/xanthine dehydrogenase FAD-binding subunit
VLLVYDAELELVAAGGTRRVPYAGFHRGYKQMDLAPGELIAAVRLPRRDPGAWREVYHKVGTRRAQAISKLCFAGALRLDGGVVAEARLAFGAVAPVPLRCTATEAVLRGQVPGPELLRAAQAALAAEVAPIDDFRSTARYRRHVAQNLLAELLLPPG